MIMQTEFLFLQTNVIGPIKKKPKIPDNDMFHFCDIYLIYNPVHSAVVYLQQSTD
jgi:hypothetical protein